MEDHSKNQNKKKNIIEKYNSTSHFYDKRYKKIQKEKYEILLKNYTAYGKLILDLGCGTGLSFDYMSKLFKKQGQIMSIYVGLDISWNMLLEFKLKIIKCNYSNYAPNLILSDINCLPFRDNMFLSIFAITSFQNLPDIKDGIKESFRVSKNNAEFKFSILKKKLDLDSLFNIFKTKIRDLIIINNEDLEDVVIQGSLLKD